jgi:hypothetical protein
MESRDTDDFKIDWDIFEQSRMSHNEQLYSEWYASTAYISPFGAFNTDVVGNHRKPLVREFDASHDYVMPREGFETSDDFILSPVYNYGIIMGPVIYWFEIGTGKHVFTQKTALAKWDVMPVSQVKLVFTLNRTGLDIVTAADDRDPSKWSRTARDKKKTEDEAKWQAEFAAIQKFVEDAESEIEALYGSDFLKPTPVKKRNPNRRVTRKKPTKKALKNKKVRKPLLKVTE